VVGLSWSLIGTSFAKHKKQPPSDTASADFDFFLLTLSWAPDFCASNPKGRSSAECDPKQHKGLVVRGLWPHYDNGKWPQDCATTPPVPSSTVKHMMPIMPGKQVIQHEWSNHGTCSGLSVKDYFGAIEKLYNGLQVPDDFQHPSSSTKTSAAEIEKKFAAANNAPKGALRVFCPPERVLGIGFATADQIAQKIGIPRDSLDRARAGIHHVLLEATSDGHCALPLENLKLTAVKLLEIPEATIEQALSHMLTSGFLLLEEIDSDALIFLPHLRKTEEGIAAKIKALTQAPMIYPPIDFEKAIT
jgi:ribonuclease I